MKTIIYQPNNLERNSYVINPKFYEFSKDFNFSIYASKIYRPKKDKVEALAKCIDELKVYNNEIETINDVINIIKKLEIKINSNINHGTSFVPINLFLRYEINELNKNKINDVIATKYLQNKIYRKVNNQALISYKGKIKTVIMEEGITSIGKLFFRYQNSLEYIQIPSTCQTIASGSFEECSSLNEW